MRRYALAGIGVILLVLILGPMPGVAAGDDGTVSWSWRLANTRAPGTWPVEVQCAQGDKKGFLTTQIDVQG